MLQAVALGPLHKLLHTAAIHACTSAHSCPKELLRSLCLVTRCQHREEDNYARLMQRKVQGARSTGARD